MNIQKYRILSLIFIATIFFSSVLRAQTDADTSIATDNEKQIQTVTSWNMDHSLFGVYLFGGAGYPFGDIMDTEKDLTTLTVEYGDGYTATGVTDHYLFYYGINGDVYLYSDSIIKAGFRARFIKGIIQQEIGVGGEEHEGKQYHATLIDFNSLMGGGILIWSPFTHGNVWLIGFVTVGKLLSSTINPMPVLNKENNSEYPFSKSSYDVNGTMFEIGSGAQYAFSRIILGLNAVYTQFLINIEDNPYEPLVSDKSNIYAFSLELFAGVHF